MNTVRSSKPGRGAAQPRVQHVVVVCARDQLRQRGRAAGQQHRRHVTGVGPARAQRVVERRVGRRRVDAIAQAALARQRLAGDEHRAQLRELLLHLRRHGREVEVADRVRHDVGHRAGGAQEVPHLGVAVRAQRHHRDGADPVQRQVGDDEVDGVRQLQHHAVAGREAVPAKRPAPGAWSAPPARRSSAAAPRAPARSCPASGARCAPPSRRWSGPPTDRSPVARRNSPGQGTNPSMAQFTDRDHSTS